MDSPAELMFKNLEPEIKKGLQELGINYLEWDQASVKFYHKGSGRSFEVSVKEIKSLML